MRSDTLHTSFCKDPVTLDPRKCGDAVSSAAIFLLFKGLTRLQANHEVVLDVAESFHISHHGKRYVFEIGEHMWSNGTPITAFDFERSWKRVLSPDFPSLSAHLFYLLKNGKRAKAGKVSVEKIGVRADGPKTLIIDLEEPVPYFLELVSFCSFFPVHSDGESLSLLPRSELVCSGPFQLVVWEPKDKIVLKQNLLAKNPFPIFLKRVEISILPDVKYAFSLFEKGQIDWFGEPFSPLPINHLPVLLENYKIQPIAGISLCFFNTQSLPFSNQHLRKAFSYAIPREKLLQKLSIPHASIAEGFIPPLLKGNPETQLSSLGHSISDKKLAQEFFLKGVQEMQIEAKDLSLTLIFEASEMWLQLAKNLQKSWQELFSLSITLEPLDFKTFYDRLSRRQYTFALARWMAQYTSPMNIFERFRDKQSGKNFSAWENREYEKLLQKYVKQAHKQKALDIADRAEKILMLHMPAAPIYYFSYSYLKKPYVKNLLFSPLGRVYLEQVFFDLTQTDISQLSSQGKLPNRL